MDNLSCQFLRSLDYNPELYESVGVTISNDRDLSVTFYRKKPFCYWKETPEGLVEIGRDEWKKLHETEMYRPFWVHRLPTGKYYMTSFTGCNARYNDKSYVYNGETPLLYETALDQNCGSLVPKAVATYETREQAIGGHMALLSSCAGGFVNGGEPVETKRVW